MVALYLAIPEQNAFVLSPNVTIGCKRMFKCLYCTTVKKMYLSTMKFTLQQINCPAKIQLLCNQGLTLTFQL